MSALFSDMAEIQKYIKLYIELSINLIDKWLHWVNYRKAEQQTKIKKRRGKRDFIPATSFFITVIGVRQRKERTKGVKMEEEERKGKSKQQNKIVNQSQKRLPSVSSEVRK